MKDEQFDSLVKIGQEFAQLEQLTVGQCVSNTQCSDETVWLPVQVDDAEA